MKLKLKNIKSASIPKGSLSSRIESQEGKVEISDFDIGPSVGTGGYSVVWIWFFIH